MEKTLFRRKHDLAKTSRQLEILSDHDSLKVEPFQSKLEDLGIYPLKPVGIEVFQINVGKMCNQVCKHCHVDAGPDRKEIMTRETMEECLKAIDHPSVKIVDITGGAPEMNPNFKWFVEEISKLGKQIVVRCNLTIILANPKFEYLPQFYKDHKINIVSSLPYFNARRTDAQRGEGVFEKSIQALTILNQIGYGHHEDYQLDLVYNPTGAYLPGAQEGLEKEFKRRLENNYGIVFNNLFAITNIPVSRFLDYLINSQNLEEYMQELLEAFNSSAAMNVMCRNTISVSWDGYLYDCDFNQMLELKVNTESNHIRNFNFENLNERNIEINQHCYGCTAGAGSSCGGSLV